MYINKEVMDMKVKTTTQLEINGTIYPKNTVLVIRRRDGEYSDILQINSKRIFSIWKRTNFLKSVTSEIKG